MPPETQTLTIHYHKQKNNCFLYSVNTYLAHYICERFYNGIHYVWCAPSFNSDVYNNPPSSNPKEIFFSLYKDVTRNDNHSDKIRQNRLGLMRGVEVMLTSGVITPEVRDEILLIIENADISYFIPLLFIIDKNQAQGKIETVPHKDRANILSEEYLIKNLHTDEFDVVHV